jgi:hypothetical protein
MFIKFEHGKHYLSDSPQGPWKLRELLESRQRRRVLSDELSWASVTTPTVDS